MRFVELDCVSNPTGVSETRAKLPGVRPDGQVSAKQDPILEFQKEAPHPVDGMTAELGNSRRGVHIDVEWESSSLSM